MVPEQAYRLSRQVALRPEPFGALAYHYGTRRLNFLRSPDLLRVVECLSEHPDVPTALTACGIAEHRRSAFTSALAALADSGFIEPFDADAVTGEAGDAVRCPATATADPGSVSS